MGIPDIDLFLTRVIQQTIMINIYNKCPRQEYHNDDLLQLIVNCSNIRMRLTIMITSDRIRWGMKEAFCYTVKAWNVIQIMEYIGVSKGVYVRIESTCQILEETKHS